MTELLEHDEELPHEIVGGQTVSTENEVWSKVWCSCGWASGVHASEFLAMNEGQQHVDVANSGS